MKEPYISNAINGILSKPYIRAFAVKTEFNPTAKQKRMLAEQKRGDGVNELDASDGGGWLVEVYYWCGQYWRIGHSSAAHSGITLDNALAFALVCAHDVYERMVAFPPLYVPWDEQ